MKRNYEKKLTHFFKQNVQTGETSTNYISNKKLVTEYKENCFKLKKCN